MYKSRCKKQNAKRPSTFREHNFAWKVRATCSNVADKVIKATHIAFRDHVEFAGQLSKTGGNANLIEYFSEEVVTNTVF